MGHVGEVGDHVELVIHAVDEVDIGNATDRVHRPRSIGPPPAIGMTGAVLGATIGFGLDDDARHACPVGGRNHQQPAEQPTGYRQDVRTGVKLAGELSVAHR